MPAHLQSLFACIEFYVVFLKMPKRKSVGSGNTSVASPAKQEKATTPAKKQRKVESPVTKSPAQKQQSPKGNANEVEKKGKKKDREAQAREKSHLFLSTLNLPP